MIFAAKNDNAPVLQMQTANNISALWSKLILRRAHTALTSVGL